MTEAPVTNSTESVKVDSKVHESESSAAGNAVGGNGKTASVTGGSTKSENSNPSVAEVIAELEAKDFDKFIPLKDEKGQVVKRKVKEVVNELYSTKGHLTKAQKAAQAQLDATIQELVNYAKTNPRDFLSRIGHDPVTFAESTLKEQVKMLEMTPEQKRIKELEAEREQWLQDKQRKEEEAKTFEERQKQQKEIQAIDIEMSSAFKESGLPKKKFFFQWASALMHDSLVRAEHEQFEKGYIENQPLSAKDAVAIVKDKFPSLLKESLTHLEVKQLREWLGEEIIEKLRQDNIARVTNQSAEAKKPLGTPTKTAKEPKVFIKDEDWRAYVESKKI